MKYLLLFLLLTSPLLASNVILVPFDEYIGSLPPYETCHFSYSPGTVLTSGTRLRVDPPTEHYGPGSTVKPGDGMTCGDCAVSTLTMDSTGVTTLQCEVAQ